MNGSILMIALIVMLVATSSTPLNAQFFSPSFDISPKETRSLIATDTNVVFLDVRSPMEYNEERIANTPLMPLQYLEQRINNLDKFKNKKIIVYCHSGNRSELAVEIMREYGFNAFNMQGGILRWKAERFPTINGPIK